MVARRTGLALRAVAVALPALLAIVLLLAGTALAAYGVDMLFGRGWALITAAVPFLVIGAILLRGIARG